MAVLLLVVALCIYGAIHLRSRETNEVANNAEQLVRLSYGQFDENDKKVEGTDGNLTFSPFFASDHEDDNYSERLKGTCNQVGKSDILFIDVGVNNGGTLKDGVITINSRNFRYQTRIPQSSNIKNNCVSSNLKKIELNDMTSGNSIMIMGDIFASITSGNDYSRENEITLTGTWYANGDEDGQSGVHIEKTVKLTVDWYGEAKADIEAKYTSINLNDFRASSNKEVEFDFTVNETKRQLLPEENTVEVTIPAMYDCYPESVTCKNTGVTSEYNKEDHKLIITKQTSAYSNKYTIVVTYPEEAYDQLDNGNILSVPITAKYKCYNNPKEEFQTEFKDKLGDSYDFKSPYETEEATATKGINFYTNAIVTADYMFTAQITNKSYVTVPSKTYSISKQNIMNAYDDSKDIGTMDYTVLWGVTKTTKLTGSNLGIIMKEIDTNGNYGDRWDSYVMSDYVRNTKIYFSQSNFIPDSGFVKVYDNDTNTLIKEFSKSELSTYNSANNAYTYDAPVKHIRIETNEGNPEPGEYLRVYNIKEVDISAIKDKYSKEEMSKVSRVQTSCKGLLTNGASAQGYDECSLAVEKSYATVDVSQKNLSATDTEPKDQKITIQVPSKNISYSDWKNGEFLIAFETPNSANNKSPLAYMELKSVTSKDEKVKILGYELVKKDGKYCIKVVTENETPTSGFSINIDCKMLVNPMVSSSQINVNLYYYNDYLNLYYYDTSDKYDVNDDGKVDDKVGLSTAKMTVLSLNSFMTLETVSEYNKDEEVTIAPNIAEVERGNGNNSNGTNNTTAKINVSIMNNYDKGEVSNVVILGKIPFTGNTYVDGGDLGSKYTAEMIGKIELPKGISEGDVDVYYSEEGSQTIENSGDKEIASVITKEWLDEHGFKKFEELGKAGDNTKLSGIKSYLIVIKKQKIEKAKEYTFSYKVAIPESANINDVAYSCHKVWYDYNVDNKKVSMNASPNKVGLRLVRYYDLGLTKVKEKTVHPVQGAKYKLTEVSEDSASSQKPSGSTQNDDEEISRIVTSDSQGLLKLDNLRVNQIYTFEEILAPSAYELSDKVVRFKVVEKAGSGNQGSATNKNDELEIVYLTESNEENSGATKFDENATIEKSADGKYTLKGNVEDTPKFELNITKKAKADEGEDESEGKPLSGVIFEIYEGDEDGEQGSQYKQINKQRVVTDSEGKATIKNLSLGKVYILKETYAKGYYLLDEIKFKVVEEDSQYKIKYINGENEENAETSGNHEGYEFSQDATSSDSETDLIQINVDITNEKIPTYKLKIKKVEESNKIGPQEEEEKVLSGAEFLLERNDLGNSEFFTTNEDGTIEVDDMYAYVEGRSGITGQYTLKETKAPAGYVNNREEITFVVSQIKDEDDLEEDENAEPQFEVKLVDPEKNNSPEEQEDLAINNFETIKDIEKEGDTITIIIQDKPLFKLTKIDKETNEPLANTDFIIYEIDKETGSIKTDDQGNKAFAKDVNGNYVGTKREDGTYVVTTDEQGAITLALGPGNYKVVEVGFPEGYEEIPHSEVFTISGNEEKESHITIPEIKIEEPKSNKETTKEFEIKTIEDLLDFAYAVDSGITFSNTTVKLANDLDFNKVSSYNSPDSNYKYNPKKYEEYKVEGEEVSEEESQDSEGKDINGDSKVEDIKTELTKKEGGTGNNAKGFPSIGIGNYNAKQCKPFSGIFDGQGHKIENLYINDITSEYKGLFACVNNAVIKNIEVTGEVTAKGNIGGLCGYALGSIYLENCYNKCNVISNNESNSYSNSYTGGLIGNITTDSNNNEFNVSIIGCKNSGVIDGGNNNQYAGVGGLIGFTDKRCNTLYIKESNNEGDIKAISYAGGICGNIKYKKLHIENVSNTANIATKESYSPYIGGIIGYIDSDYTNTDVRQAYISNVKNSGNITGRNYIAGVIGWINEDKRNNGYKKY